MDVTHEFAVAASILSARDEFFTVRGSRTDGQDTNDRRRPCRAGSRAEALPAGRTTAHHSADHRGALHGDLSENAEYHAAKESQSLNEGRIAELEDKLARAEVIDVSKLSGDTIKFGATVTLIDEDTDKKAVWQLVGEPEADAKKGRISITSPLARALVGKKKGASVEVVAPGGAKAYEVVKVEWR